MVYRVNHRWCIDTEENSWKRSKDGESIFGRLQFPTWSYEHDYFSGKPYVSFMSDTRMYVVFSMSDLGGNGIRYAVPTVDVYNGMALVDKYQFCYNLAAPVDYLFLLEHQHTGFSQEYGIPHKRWRVQMGTELLRESYYILFDGCLAVLLSDLFAARAFVLLRCVDDVVVVRELLWTSDRYLRRVYESMR